MVCGWPFCKTAGILQVLPSFCRHSVSITSVITTDTTDSCKIPCIFTLSPRSAARLRRLASLRLPLSRPDGATEPPPALRPHRLNMPAAVTPLPSPRPGSTLVSAAGGWCGAPTPSQAEALPLDLSFSGSPLGGVLQDSILLFTTVRGINARARVRPGAGLCRLFAILTAAGAVFLWGSVFPLPRHFAGLLGLPVVFLCFRRISEGIPRRQESLPDVLTISAAAGVPWLPREMAQAVRRGEKSATKKRGYRRFPVPSLALCVPVLLLLVRR